MPGGCCGCPGGRCWAGVRLESVCSTGQGWSGFPASARLSISGLGPCGLCPSEPQPGWGLGAGLCASSAWLSVPGLQRRRLIPAPLPDAAALGRKPSLPGQWVDLPPPLAGALKEPFEIKVYEIDDVERLQRRRLPPREGPAEVGVAVGCWEGGRASWCDRQPADFTFPSRPQPSQSSEKVGAALLGLSPCQGKGPMATSLVPWNWAGWGAFPWQWHSSWAWVPGGHRRPRGPVV